jgi:hypothetical protein
MLGALWDVLSPNQATGIVEWEGYICGQNILLLCCAYGTQANNFLHVLLASSMKLIYCIAVYRTVLDRKGWWKGAKRGERRGTERN